MFVEGLEGELRGGVEGHCEGVDSRLWIQSHGLGGRARGLDVRAGAPWLG